MYSYTFLCFLLEFDFVDKTFEMYLLVDKCSLVMLANIYWFTTTHWNLKSRLRNFCLTIFIVVSRIYHLFIVFLSVKRVKKPKKTIWCDFTEWKSKDTRIAPNVIESENGSQTSVVTKFFWTNTQHAFTTIGHQIKAVTVRLIF